MNFDHIILEEEQKDLFIKIVESIKKIPRENRGPMIEAISKDVNCLVMPGESNISGFASGDPETLSNAGLLNLGFGSRESKNYTVTPYGFQYYDWLMKQQGKPVERVETYIRKYIELAEFKNFYHEAYQKLKQAEEKLWAGDSLANYTTIGH